MHEHLVVSSHQSHEFARERISQRNPTFFWVLHEEHDRLFKINFLDIALPVAECMRLVRFLGNARSATFARPVVRDVPYRYSLRGVGLETTVRSRNAKKSS